MPSCHLTVPSGPVSTDGILSFLKSSKPGDALCVLGLTLSDLYPHEAWTFTFGTFLPGHGEPAPGAPASTLGLGHRPGAPGNVGPLLRLPGPLPRGGGVCPRLPSWGHLAGRGLQDLCSLAGSFAPGLPDLRPRLAPLPLCLPPEVGVCSFARFSGEFLPRGPSTPDLAEVEAAADGPEVPLQDGGQAVCFSALGMVQCCKVGVEAGGRVLLRWWERTGDRKGEGLGARASFRERLGGGVGQKDVHGQPVVTMC